MTRLRSLILATSFVALFSYAAHAQTTGSAGCVALAQAAANAVSTRISADDANIAAPQSVKSLTCLDNFFKGTGLNVVVNLLNPTQLLQSIETQICNKLTSMWKSSLGGAQCGITMTGFKIGFLGGNTLGGGLSCPKLAFGGGGPPIGSIGVGNNNSGKLYVTGNAVAPTGYPLTSLLGLY